MESKDCCGRRYFSAYFCHRMRDDVSSPLRHYQLFGEILEYCSICFALVVLASNWKK